MVPSFAIRGEWTVGDAGSCDMWVGCAVEGAGACGTQIFCKITFYFVCRRRREKLNMFNKKPNSLRTIAQYG